MERLNESHHSDPLQIGYLTERQLWLIQLRWIAIGGILGAVTAAAWSGLISRALPLLLVVAFMGIYNLIFWRGSSAKSDQISAPLLQKRVFLQVLLDLGALTILLHQAGGVENPFVLFFAFHMAIGAMLLPLKMTLYLGMVASVFHGASVLAEFAGVLAHHSLRFAPTLSDSSISYFAFWRSPSFVLGYLLAFVLMLFGVIYFVHSIATRYRHAETLRQESERVALSRERLAHVGEISAGVAHTIRNPLHGVLNCVEILRARRAPDDSTQEILSLMSEGLQRIESVTQRLLVLTREAALQKTSTDINTLVRDALDFIEVQSQEKRVKIQMDLKEVPVIEIDANQFNEAFLNVLDNALDACSNGGTITVKTYVSRQKDPVVHIEIGDTGEGIAAEHLPRVFDPFFTTKAIGKGSGLGLGIARRVIEEHGGRIVLESQVGKGTRVSFLIPLNTREEEREGTLA
ncbi:ATP-binding protein [Acidobacteria bacterium AH-259-D05]|nr:ATP-binding protein [Acidobacteria bacterium AH-259-D05]